MSHDVHHNTRLTAYFIYLDVPCGNYQIQPRVIAHLRLATQAVLPKETPDLQKESFNGENRREGRQSIPPLRSFLDPFRLERQLQSYNPYESQQFPPQRPTFRPRTCRWNFDVSPKSQVIL